MFGTLIASRPAAGGHRMRWGAASVVTHGLLIAGAVGMTVTHPTPRPAPPDPRPIFISTPAPAPRPTTRPSRATVVVPDATIVPVVHRLVLATPTFDCDPGAATALDALLSSLDADTSTTSDSGSAAAPAGGVYDAAFVDRSVTPRDGNPQPRYPEQLRAAGIEGTVVARFVVDTLGRVEPASIAVVASSQVAFAGAVRDALLRSRFVPAQYGGGKVRQLVEQRFQFALSR